MLFVPEDKASSTHESEGQISASSNAAPDAAPSESQSPAIPLTPGATVKTQPTGRHPALLVVGGSEGGTPVRRAAWLASHGYVALALAYFHAPGLPDQLRDIPLEYFGHSLSWLAQRPEVVRLDYAKAGHRAGSPEIIPAWHGELRHPVSGRPEDLGGTPEGNAASGLDAAPRILEFLARAFATTASSSIIAPASAPPH